MKKKGRSLENEKMKLLAVMVAVMMLAVSLAACGSSSQTGTDTQTPTSSQTPSQQSAGNSSQGAAQPVDIQFWTFQDLHIEFYEKMAEKWNQQNPDRPINLIPTVYPYDDMHNKLLIALQSGVGAPDLVDIEIGKYANFLKGDIQLVPLNDIVEP